MIRLLRDISIAGGVLLLFGLAIAAYLSIATVRVHNKTDNALTGVKIGFTGKELWSGDLEVGNSKWVFGLPNQDGSIEVSYAVGDQTYSARCGYVSAGPMRRSFDIALLSRGRSNCAESD